MTDFSEGEEAVDELADWTHGAFRMEFGPVTRTRSIYKDSQILLEEAQRRAGFRTQPFQKLSRVEGHSDIGKGLLFAGELEPAINRLSSTGMRTQPQAALELLAEAVNRSISFLERDGLLTTATQTLEGALTEIRKAVPQARYLVCLHGRIGIQDAVNTLRFGEASPEEGAGALDPVFFFRQSSQALLMLLHTFLEMYGQTLTVPAERQDWAETAGLLLTEFSRAADGIVPPSPAQKQAQSKNPALKR